MRSDLGWTWLTLSIDDSLWPVDLQIRYAARAYPIQHGLWHCYVRDQCHMARGTARPLRYKGLSNAAGHADRSCSEQ